MYHGSRTGQRPLKRYVICEAYCEYYFISFAGEWNDFHYVWDIAKIKRILVLTDLRGGGEMNDKES